MCLCKLAHAEDFQIGVALRILGVAPKVGEKDMALSVDEKRASYVTPLHAPVCERESLCNPL